MDETTLRALVATAKGRSFTAAARQLGVSQPTVTRQVQRLEEEIGAKVFVRAPGGLVLTEAGERYIPHAEAAIAALDSGAAEVAELGGEPRGQVTLGALPTVAAYVLPRVVAHFRPKHPAVRIHIHEGFSSILAERVSRGELDLAVVSGAVSRQELSARLLFVEQHVLAVPRGHRLATARKVRLEDLVDETFVEIPGTPATQALAHTCATHGRVPQIALATDNVESVRRMVEAGLGVALVPELLTRGKQDWRAHVIPLAGKGLERRVFLIHRGAGYLTAAARALREAIIDLAAHR